MFSPLLELDEDSNELSYAALMWLVAVGVLAYLSKRTQQRDAAQRIDEAARGQVELIRQQQRERHAEVRSEVDSNSAAAGGSSSPSSASSSAAASAPAPPREREDCPICLDKVSWPVDTNCSHQYCGECLISYHEQQGGLMLSMVKCPCCRRGVDVILPTGWTEAENNSDQGRTLQTKIDTYNRRYSSQPRSWNHAISETPHYLRRFYTELMTGGDSSLRMFRLIRFWVVIISTFLYLFSPFDLIPEAFFGFIGLLDDFLFVLVVLVIIGGFVRSSEVQQQHDAEAVQEGRRIHLD